MSDEWVGKGLALLCGLAFAGSTICTRRGMKDSNATTAAILSLLINAAFFLTVLVASGELYVRSWQSLLFFLAAGLFAPALARVLSYISMARIGASVSAPIVASESLFAALIGVLIFHEVLGVVTWIGILIVFAGLLMLSGRNANVHAGARREGERRDRFYFALAVLAAICYGISINLRAEGLALDNRPSFGAAFSSLSSVAMLPLVYGVARQSDATLRFRLTRDSLGWFLAAAGCVTAAWYFQFLALSTTPAPVVSTLTSARTVFIVLMAYLFLRGTERVTRPMAVGSVVVFVGVLLI